VWPDYDEDKVMLGWSSADAAKAAYLAQYDDPRFFGGMSVFTADDFKRQLVANPGRKLTHADPRERVLRVDVGEGRRARMLMDLSREGLGGGAAKAEQAAGPLRSRSTRSARSSSASRARPRSASTSRRCSRTRSTPR
jgi:hypothetical protein